MLRLPRLRDASARLLFACLAWLFLATVARAELPWSRLDCLFPAGARSGSSVQLRLAGSGLETGTALRFSHAGIAGVRIPGSSPADNLFEVQVAPDVPPGLYDVAAAGPLGLTNARTFAVGFRDEFTEAEPNESPAIATTVALGSVVNGRIGKATDVDSFSFRAAPGRKIVADCLATRLDSPLLPVLEVLDARGRRIAFARSGREKETLLVFEPPAEGDYVLRIYDQTYRGGDEYVYRLELHADPHVVAVQPGFGTTGSAATASVLGLNLPAAPESDQRWGPWTLQQVDVSVAFPGDRFQYDRILPVTPREAAADSFSWRLGASPPTAQPVRLHLGNLQPLLEVEPNQQREQAQTVKLPAEISGRFGTVGDMDHFSVAVRKDEPIWIEVFADRLGSPADAAIRVDFIPAGTTEATRIATVDDNASSLLPLGFETRSDDPAFRFQPPADGTCLIQLRDQYGQTRGDATLAYQLIVRRPESDFRLVAVPTSQGIGKIAPASLRKGDALEFTLVAFRQDGFDGAIEVPPAELAPGLSTTGTLVPKGQSTSPLIIRSTTEADAPPRVIEIHGQAVGLEAEAANAKIVRAIRPAVTVRSTTKIQTRDIPADVRLAREFIVAVAAEPAPLEIDHALAQQSVPQGAALDVPLRLLRRPGAEAPVTATIQGLPKTAKIEATEVTFAPGETEKTVKLNIGADAPPQTLVVNWIARTKVRYRSNTAQRDQARLALEDLNRRIQVATEEARTAEAEKAQAELALTNATRANNDKAVDLGPFEAAKTAADRRAGESAARLKQLQDERVALEKKNHDLEQAVQELDAAAVTSPLILNIQPTEPASPPAASK